MANFPSLNEKNKDKEYHKKFVQAIIRDGVTSNYDAFNISMTILYDYYNGTQSGDEYNFLQEAEDGDVLPAKWINYNKIRTKVNLLMGEMDEKGYEIIAKTINTDSKVRKQEEKRQLLTQVKINKDLKDLEADMGLPISEPNLPESEEEVEDYFQYEYKDIYELIMSQAVKYCTERAKFRHLRLDLFRDLLVTGRFFVKSEIQNDLPYVRRIDPRNMVFDTSAEDPFLRDATYFGEIRYMSIADAAEQYNLDKKQLEEAYKQSKDHTSMTHRSHTTEIPNSSAHEAFKREGSEIKVMVFTGIWQDTKPFNHKVSKDKYGNDHVKFLGERDEKDKDNQKVERRNIKIWRKGTIIGTDILVDWGEIENTPRSIDNITDTPCPYMGCIMNWVNQRSVSIVEQLKGLQDLKNIAMYNVQLAMARAGAKGFVYDVSQLPEDWEPETAIRYLKTTGIAFIDSMKDGVPKAFNQFSSIDLSLSQSVTYFLEISRMIDAEIDVVSGLNDAREGHIQYASQTVGVTQSSLLQSNLKTKTLYTYFDGAMDNVLNHQAGLVKIAWENKEKFAPIIGDVGVDFLSQEIDVDLQDYAMFIEYIPTVLRDKDTLQNLILAAMQQGEISIVDAIKIIREKDTVMAVRKLEKATMRREAMMMAMQQSQMQQQQAAQMEAMQQQAAAQQQETQGQREHEMQVKAFDRDTEIAKAKLNMAKR